MSASKLDMSLDDIIKLTNPGRGRGRGARGRGSLRARGGLSRGNRRGATAGFRGRGRSRIGVGFGRRGVGGVLRGGIQKRRGFRQTSFARGRAGAAWRQAIIQSGFQQQTNVGSGNASGGGIGKLLISNLDFGVNDADIKELFSEFGTMRKAAVHYDRTGRSLGTAEVIYIQRRSAVNALRQYNNVPLDGRPMNIQLVGGQNTMPASASTAGSARGFGRGRGGGRGRMRGFGRRGRGGRGGASQVPTKDELDAQLDAYNAKMDTY